MNYAIGLLALILFCIMWNAVLAWRIMIAFRRFSFWLSILRSRISKR